MNKQEFLTELRKGLSGLPKEDIEERLTFYSEMIDDRMEEGLSEDAAVSDIGAVDEIVQQIIADIPLTKLVKEKIKPKRKMKAWEIVLLILGSPVWLPLLIVAFAIILVIYVCLWVVIIALWSVFAAFAASAFGCIVGCFIYFFHGNPLGGIAVFGTGIACAGLSIFLFFGCLAASKGIIKLTKKIAIGIKNCFIRKEDAE